MSSAPSDMTPPDPQRVEAARVAALTADTARRSNMTVREEAIANYSWNQGWYAALAAADAVQPTGRDEVRVAYDAAYRRGLREAAHICREIAAKPCTPAHGQRLVDMHVAEINLASSLAHRFDALATTTDAARGGS